MYLQSYSCVCSSLFTQFLRPVLSDSSQQTCPSIESGWYWTSWNVCVSICCLAFRILSWPNGKFIIWFPLFSPFLQQRIKPNNFHIQTIYGVRLICRNAGLISNSNRWKHRDTQCLCVCKFAVTLQKPHLIQTQLICLLCLVGLECSKQNWVWAKFCATLK